jgi:tungstate transport system permease protein
MILEGMRQGIELLFTADPDVWDPVKVSVTTSAASTLLAALLGLPVALAIAGGRFPGRGSVEALLHTLMALPTVLVGLVFYALLGRSGPLGDLGFLYTTTAMVVGQTVLAFPIVAGLTVSALEGADPRIRLSVLGLGGGSVQAMLAVARERAGAIAAAVAAGFGRVFAEVGVALMLGGNIRGATRTITTGIALETGKGEFARGIALGVVLLAVALAVNIGAALLRKAGRRG